MHATADKNMLFVFRRAIPNISCGPRRVETNTRVSLNGIFSMRSATSRPVIAFDKHVRKQGRTFSKPNETHFFVNVACGQVP